MKKAWIENQRIRDISPGNPQDWYHSEVAGFYNIDVPDEAANGDGWVNGQLVKPEAAPLPLPEEPVPRTWTQDNIRAGLTLSEKVKWDSNSVPEIVTVKTELSISKELPEITELLQLLVDKEVISQSSMNKVLT